MQQKQEREVLKHSSLLGRVWRHSNTYFFCYFVFTFN